MSGPKNVYRINQKSQPGDAGGWQVRVRRQGERYTKYFADGKHGGRKEALGAAVAYRDRLIEKLPGKASPEEASAKARSKTGVVGLTFAYRSGGRKKGEDAGRYHPTVQINWLAEGGAGEGQRAQRNATFSISKWGFEEALWKACTRLSDARAGNPAGTQDPEPPEAMFRRAARGILRRHQQIATRKRARGKEVADEAMPDPESYLGPPGASGLPPAQKETSRKATSS